MNYLIIVLVVALMVSPVFWMMPSRKQKRQTQLRQHAMALGFQVKLCNLPQTHREEVRKVREEQGVVYRLPWPNARPVRDSFHHLLIRGEVEEDTAKPSSAINILLKGSLESLPEAVLALEYASSGLAVYWREQGTMEQLEQLYTRLGEIQNQFLELS